MEAKTKEILGRIVIAGIAAWLIALIPTCAHAALTAEQATLVQWRGADYKCRSDPLNDGGACARRDHYSKTLAAHGWARLDHDVWASPDEQMAFALVVRNSPHGDNEIDAVHRAVSDLRGFIPHDDVIVALWREHRESIQWDSPARWAILSEAVREIIAAHDPNDIRFMLN